jgi:hypothetical protein
VEQVLDRSLALHPDYANTLKWKAIVAALQGDTIRTRPCLETSPRPLDRGMGRDGYLTGRRSLVGGFRDRSIGASMSTNGRQLPARSRRRLTCRESLRWLVSGLSAAG